MTPVTLPQMADALDSATELLAEFLPADHAELNRLLDVLGAVNVQLLERNFS